MALLLSLFPGSAFGVQRYLKGCLSFYGQQLGVWTAARGSILTIDNLVLRRLPLVNWFCMCWCDEETVDHLLLHCKFAYALWSEVFLIFGIQWVMLKTVASLLFGWWNWPGKHSSNIWKIGRAHV